MTIEVKTTARKNWTIWHTLALLLIVVAIGVFGTTLERQQAQLAFIMNMVLLAAFATIAGHGTVGFWMGLLIDERNRMSLAWLQMVLWTILILSGFLTAALSNISSGVVNPLAIPLPRELWLLLGISTTSLVGSPLILSTKAAAPVGRTAQLEAQTQRTLSGLARQGLDPSTVTAEGKVIAWQWPGDARFADLFQGDEIGNAAHLDLGKVQMFFFTLVLVLAYGVALARMFAGPDSFAFPTLDEDNGMVALLGISHAGYLANKAVPHTAP